MAAVSVILPTFNRASTLARSINSVLNQTYSPIELIVVDDASNDETREIVRQYEHDCRVRYIHLLERGGAGIARNIGIANARCQLLAFQDSDDEWHSSKLDKQVEAFAHCENGLGVVYSDMMRIFRDGTSRYFPAPEVKSGTGIVDSRTNQYCVENIGIQSCLIRRQFLEQTGGFNETYPALEDLELFIRLSQICEFKRLPEPLVNYYQTDGVSSNFDQVALARRKLVKQYAKGIDKAWVASELAAIAIQAQRLRRDSFPVEHG